MQKGLAYMLTLVILLAFIWSLGFLWFLGLLPDEADHNDFRHTDVIVVLTGGKGRIELGLQRLEQGASGKLYISGVNESSPSDAVFADDLQKNRRYSRFKNAIEIGRKARDTQGNALETLEWMEKHKFTSLRLVTAGYHMPRSLLLFRQAMPDVELVADPVYTANFPRQWWRSLSGIRLVLTEYHKYMVTLALNLGHKD